ncbi:MAG TPA: cysteine peptidase family C39 domain-containing protein [Ignavibacteriaceae bacterium]|nr:cysteine peptidase family C39 domain-containing protein [Ignavibacteriaceae bacterium]
MKQLIKNKVERFTNYLNSIEKQKDPNATYLGLRRFNQVDRYSCGIQCAYSILDYYKRLTTDVELDKLINKNGTDFDVIKNIFQDYGLNISEKYDSSLLDIKNFIDKEFPLLTTINDTEHWVVIYGYSMNKKGISHLFIMDPVLKRLKAKWTINKFKKHWREWDEQWLAIISG